MDYKEALAVAFAQEYTRMYMISEFEPDKIAANQLHLEVYMLEAYKHALDTFKKALKE